MSQPLANKPRTSKAFGSVFDDLPGPELYDPSWHSNKLRGEFGRLGDATVPGPVLPKSYQQRSEDLEDLDDTDDDSEAPTTIRSSDMPSAHPSDNHNLHERDASSSALSSRPELINHQDSVSNLHTISDKYHSLNMSSTPIDSVLHPPSTSSLFNSSANIRISQSTPKRAIRFSRKSMFGFSVDSTTHLEPPQAQQPPQYLDSQKDFSSIGKRHSKMFRPSRLFGHAGRPTHSSGLATNHGSSASSPRHASVSGGKQTLSRSVLRRSAGPSKGRHASHHVNGTHFLGTGFGVQNFGRRSIIFQWPIAPLDCLFNLRTLLETRFSATATVEKSDELRMQVPVNSSSEARVGACAVVIAVDHNSDGSRVLLRRSLGDSLRGGSDEFDWLCAQITEHLRQFKPAIRMVFP